MNIDPPLATPPGGPPPLPSFEPLEFHGSGKEYFRIWIVNFFLTILTLGIYTPWARVRTRRYFYRNTRMAGHAFDYTADPRKLLLGYGIVALLMLVYFFGEWISVFLSLGAVLVFFVLSPWIRWKSARFRAANSTYRHLRMGFSGTCGEAYRVFLGFPLVAMLTGGLVYPWVMFRQRQYYFGNLRYGGSESRFSGQLDYFFKVVLGIGGVAFVVGMVLMVGMITAITASVAAMPRSSQQEAPLEQVETGQGDVGEAGAEGIPEPELADFVEDEDFATPDFESFERTILASVFGIYGVMGLSAVLIHALLLNHCWSHFSILTRAGAVSFRSQLHPGRFLWIVMSNLLLTILTLGVFIRAIGWLRVLRSGVGDEAEGFGAMVGVVEEGLVE